MTTCAISVALRPDQIEELDTITQDAGGNRSAVVRHLLDLALDHQGADVAALRARIQELEHELETHRPERKGNVPTAYNGATKSWVSP